MQIELLELMNDGPSLLRDFALKQGQGLQHMAYWVETFDDVLAQLQKQGYVVGQTGSPLGEHSRFAYVFQPSRPDSIVEISEYLGTKRALYEEIEMHSQNWDGRDPIRSEEHTSELQSLMRISYAVFCLKKKKIYAHQHKLQT